MTRTFSLASATAAMAILFACSQQPSDAQEETTPAADETMPQEEVMPSEAADSETGQESLPSMMRATGDLLGNDGSTIGNVNLIEGPNGIVMEVSVDAGGLEPGWHGIHMHQTGDCSDTGEYTNSGGHVGKMDGGHGLLNPDGPEKGDLPNIYASDDGSANYVKQRRRLGESNQECVKGVVHFDLQTVVDKDAKSKHTDCCLPETNDKTTVASVDGKHFESREHEQELEFEAFPLVKRRVCKKLAPIVRRPFEQLRLF